MYVRNVLFKSDVRILGGMLLIQYMYLVPAFVGDRGEGLLKESEVVGDDLLAHDATTRLMLIVAQAGLQGHIKDKEATKIMMPAAKIEQAIARICLQSGTIRDSQAILKHTLIDDIIEKIERIAVDLLIGFIIADERTAMVR